MSDLTATDRKDLDILSNVDAMVATNELISWFGRDIHGFLGLWRGPKNTLSSTTRPQAPRPRRDRALAAHPARRSVAATARAGNPAGSGRTNLVKLVLWLFRIS